MAQGADSPANADPLGSGPGTHAWDSTACSDTGTLATTGAVQGSCPTTEDVWFRWRPILERDHVIDTCGSSMDTALTVWEGFPGSGGVEVTCNEDQCGQQSRVTFRARPGTTYWIQVGHGSLTGGVWGSGPMTIHEIPSPNTSLTGCLSTLFAAQVSGAVGGAVYFDVATTDPVTIRALEVHTSVLGAIGLEVYTTPGTYVGAAGDPSLWTLVARDDGNATGLGIGRPAALRLDTPWVLGSGSVGVALVGRNSLTGHQMTHFYTNGNGANQVYTDGNLTIRLGAADNTPFSGGAFSPRVWNGSLCTDRGPVSWSFCQPGVPNSTGAAGVLRATGTSVVASNDLSLEAAQLPAGSFGILLNATDFVVPSSPANSVGNLCLGSGIGRSPVFQASVLGGATFSLDLTQLPGPNGALVVQPGETWGFQAWFRDAVGGSATSNLTGAVAVSFQ